LRAAVIPISLPAKVELVNVGATSDLVAPTF